MMGFITTAAHKRIVAAKDAEIAGLNEWANDLAESERRTADIASERLREIERLRAALEKFTAPRQRDSRGRYQPISRKGDAA